MKLTPKILLEGTRLTGKTDLAFALNEHPKLVGERRYRYHSPVISAEWCGFTPHPWGRGLVNFAPEEEGLALEAYRTWLRLFQLLPHYSWIADRFHVSTQVFQARENARELDFGWLEEGLAELGFHLVLCWRSKESFAVAREERLKVSGNPSQYDDLTPFVEEQERMRERVRASRLPSLELDVSTVGPDGLAERVAAWMEQTGGLVEPGPSYRPGVGRGGSAPE